MASLTLYRDGISRRELAQDVIANFVDTPTLSFGERNPMDRLVCSELNDTAAAHMSENGYVRHRMLEIEVRIGVTEFGPLANVA